MDSHDIFFLDPVAVRAMADGMGTAGAEIRVIGRGGAIADGVADGLPGATMPTTLHTVARRADAAMGAVASALLEMGGIAVGALITYEQQQEQVAAKINDAAETVR
ncbi:hypothetical protein D5S18_11010 [Nocardia panacis]|uniref:ESX-1 secretion-associated protein n=1 Tax=Nocardia panacis TaxID=2340916 RepID=A0A3A4JZD0_9NOCA|nr:hypothetical protein [Nocardia panacis]RJO76775.1 hypothetical protein D5S18_11010 [Nocardia panacis]